MLPPRSAFNKDGQIFAYAVSYDWSKGHEFYNAQKKNYIFLRSPAYIQHPGLVHILHLPPSSILHPPSKSYIKHPPSSTLPGAASMS